MTEAVERAIRASQDDATSRLRSLAGSLDIEDVSAELRRRDRQAVRSRGSTTALTDIEIAISATAADAELWSFDSDFDRIAEALPGLHRFTG